MSVYTSMLRGVNVGGQNKVSMEALRELYESLGLRDARTYIQSGNVVFRSEKGEATALSRLIHEAIQRKFKITSPVVIRTSAELQAVVERNPFAARKEVDPSKLLVQFLEATPKLGTEEQLKLIIAGPETFAVSGRELFIYFAEGQARPNFSWAKVDKAIGVSTGRNWNTVLKLQEIAKSLDGQAGS